MAVQHEAEVHLETCRGRSLADRQACNIERRDFVRQCLLARAGDLHGQRRVAHALGRRSDRNPLVSGVKADPIQACAWRLIIITYASHLDAGPEDEMEERRDCALLSDAEHSSAQLRAAELAVLIAQHPTPHPPREAELGSTGR
ncbi:hypothetical protein [Roseococcus sp. SYP-B2431]|uniref:hypothetical protein n=1 Tax=Roseococcus sp. SYP-B2431 TaxID=2496640 RepID=UPI0013F45F2A|nr:hypothetical protein [Roseococcus sp. SYP-B2431]